MSELDGPMDAEQTTTTLSVQHLAEERGSAERAQSDEFPHASGSREAQLSDGEMASEVKSDDTLERDDESQDRHQLGALSLGSVVEPVWVLPSATDHVVATAGFYNGSALVGDPASMQRIVPNVLNSVGGGHHPDTVVDAGRVSDDLFVGAASVRGASHHYAQTPRQDAYALIVSGHWVIAAIADGVGAARYSHQAATGAVTAAVQETERELARNTVSIDWEGVARRTRERVQHNSTRVIMHGTEGPNPSDRALASQMATTCDVLVAPTTRSLDGVLPVTWVRISGDSSLFVLDPVRGLGTVHQGKCLDSALIDNSVIPLPLDPGPPIVRSYNLEPDQTVILCTDGIGEVIETGESPVARYLYERWSKPRSKLELLQSMSFVNKNADDDRTAVILWGTHASNP